MNENQINALKWNKDNVIGLGDGLYLRVRKSSKTYIRRKTVGKKAQVITRLPGYETLQKVFELTLADETDLFYFGACPECGKEGQLNNIDREIWSYCEVHNTAWYILTNPNDPQAQAPPEFYQLADDRNYKIVKPIMTRLETPENKAAMLEEMKARTITPTSEFHVGDEGVRDKYCYGLHPLPDACTVQIRFSEDLSHNELTEQLKFVIDGIKERVNDFDVPF